MFEDTVFALGRCNNVFVAFPYTLAGAADAGRRRPKGLFADDFGGVAAVQLGAVETEPLLIAPVVEPVAPVRVDETDKARHVIQRADQQFPLGRRCGRRRRGRRCRCFRRRAAGSTAQRLVFPSELFDFARQRVIVCNRLRHKATPFPRI